MTVRALILDHDGVLASIDYRSAAAFFGRRLPISMGEFVQYWNGWLNQGGHEGGMRWDRFCNDLGDNLRLPGHVRRELEAFRYLDLFQPFHEVRPALLEARQRGLRVAVLSNTLLVDIWEPLHHMGLADLVDLALNPQVTGYSKPAAEAYLRVLEALELPASDCLFLDDEPANVAGAEAVGLPSYRVDRQRQTHALSERVIHDLSALPLLLPLIEGAT